MLVIHTRTSLRQNQPPDARTVGLQEAAAQMLRVQEGVAVQLCVVLWQSPPSHVRLQAAHLPWYEVVSCGVLKAVSRLRGLQAILPAFPGCLCNA